jgi:hypothetical protein
MGRPTRIRASNWPIGGSDWPVGGSRTVNRRYWQTGGTRSTKIDIKTLSQAPTSLDHTSILPKHFRVLSLMRCEFTLLYAINIG